MIMRLVGAKKYMNVMKKIIYAMELNVQRMKTANSKASIFVNMEFVIDQFHILQRILNKKLLN